MSTPAKKSEQAETQQRTATTGSETMPEAKETLGVENTTENTTLVPAKTSSTLMKESATGLVVGGAVAVPLAVVGFPMLGLAAGAGAGTAVGGTMFNADAAKLDRDNSEEGQVDSRSKSDN